VPDFLLGPRPGIAHVPLPLYLRRAARPYWLRVVPGQRAVYLKYNRWLPAPGRDPVDPYGNTRTFRLPHSGLLVEYTSAVINRSGRRRAIPGLTMAPTPGQVLAGQDPVLAAVIGRPSR
jgi:hypothetical protein